MGCCNKTPDGRPIGRTRYYGGMALMAGVQLGTLGAICALSLPLPHYRKVLPFYVEFARETLDSVRRRERICLDFGPDRAECALPDLT
ncbi:MAG: hypothetical protein QGH45_07575 [Myxococcota bacterium]|jgi:hypothetical protein|nr:hypothetical protein [Myxococcota bacterium]